MGGFIQNIPAKILFEIDTEYFCKDIIWDSYGIFLQRYYWTYNKRGGSSCKDIIRVKKKEGEFNTQSTSYSCKDIIWGIKLQVGVSYKKVHFHPLKILLTISGKKSRGAFHTELTSYSCKNNAETYIMI